MTLLAVSSAVQLPSSRPGRALERIIVGTDFSPASSRAVVRAAQLAAEHFAALEIAHVTPRPSVAGFARGVGSGASVDVAGGLNAAKSVARQLGVTASTRTLSGAAAPALARHAKESEGDLLVVGKGETRDLRGILLGTTAERLVEAWPGPTLVVQRPDVGPYRRLLACVALAPDSSSVLEFGAAVCPQAALHLMHAYVPLFDGMLRREGIADEVLLEHRTAARQRTLRELAKLIRDAHLAERAVQPCAYYGAAEDGIFVMTAWTRAELIVVGKNTSRIATLFLGSMAKHVVSEAPVDVLVCGAATPDS
jgi:nucleotide-binding universal stress UspA family protein